MSASAGRVLLIFKGDYESATTYKPLDVVIYGVNSYVCLLQSTGNVPTNTTYWQILAKGISNMSPEAIGIGYGLSQNSGASKTATLADYTLTINGIVAVTFAEDVPANATLNINSQGAKPIYYRGSAIVANVIRGGDTVTFAYDGTHYDILCIDGGAGHTVQTSAGVDLPQRDILIPHSGIETSDDSTNQKTKIGLKTDYISLADWNAMSSAEQETYKQEHYRFGIELPDTEGVINAEYMKLLWENPDSTQSFASQNITLASADYDMLRVYYNESVGGRYNSVEIPKGVNGALTFSAIGGTNSTYIENRSFIRNSDTSYTFGSGQYTLNDGSLVTDNSVLIPIAVYGIKKDFQFKMNAIASELSTRADHCFLSDDVTSVEDAITYKDVYSTDEHVVGKWIDGSDLYEKTIITGLLPNNSSMNINHGISNLNRLVEASGIAYIDEIYSSYGDAKTPFPNKNITVTVTGTTIAISTTDNYSIYNGYVTIRYTKTS